MRKDELPITELNLTTNQMMDLFLTSLSAIGIAQHDLLGDLRSMRYYIEDLSKIVPKTKRASKALQDISQTLDSMGTKFKRYFDPYYDFDHPNSFITNPYRVVKSIRTIRSYPEVLLSNDSPQSLEIVFPNNILFGILLELIENAGKQAPEGINVLIQYQVKGGKFQCEIHDNGPGIAPKIGKAFLPLDALIQRNNLRLANENGLAIINRILVLIKGILLFSNSKILGGTLVYLEFPVLHINPHK